MRSPSRFVSDAVKMYLKEPALKKDLKSNLPLTPGERAPILDPV